MPKKKDYKKKIKWIPVEKELEGELSFPNVAKIRKKIRYKPIL